MVMQEEEMAARWGLISFKLSEFCIRFCARCISICWSYRERDWGKHEVPRNHGHLDGLHNLNNDVNPAIHALSSTSSSISISEIYRWANSLHQVFSPPHIIVKDWRSMSKYAHPCSVYVHTNSMNVKSQSMMINKYNTCLLEGFPHIVWAGVVGRVP